MNDTTRFLLKLQKLCVRLKGFPSSYKFNNNGMNNIMVNTTVGKIIEFLNVDIAEKILTKHDAKYYNEVWKMMEDPNRNTADNYVSHDFASKLGNRYLKNIGL